MLIGIKHRVWTLLFRWLANNKVCTLDLGVPPRTWKRYFLRLEDSNSWRILGTVVQKTKEKKHWSGRFNCTAAGTLLKLLPLYSLMLLPLWFFTLSLLWDDLSPTSDLFQSFRPHFNNDLWCACEKVRPSFTVCLKYFFLAKIQKWPSVSAK